MKTTVYLNKVAEELLQRAKEYDPDYSVSNAIEEGLKHFVERMEKRFTGMSEKIATQGTLSHGEFCGSKSKFIGKQLASMDLGESGFAKTRVGTLYLTKKGKYLYQYVDQDERDGEQKYDYEICHSFKELNEKVPAVLREKAGSTAGELLDELDI